MTNFTESVHPHAAVGTFAEKVQAPAEIALTPDKSVTYRYPEAG